MGKRHIEHIFFTVSVEEGDIKDSGQIKSREKERANKGTRERIN